MTNKTISFLLLLFLVSGGWWLISGPANAQQNKVIVLDPGHCSNDKYNEQKVPENRLNITQANALASLLKANGYEVKVYNPNGDGSCKQEDYYLNLQDRVDFANNNNAALFISVHQDSGSDVKDAFSGIYAAAGPFAAESQRLGDTISKAAAAAVTAKGKAVRGIIQESRSVGTDQASSGSEGLDYYVLGPTGGKTAGRQGGNVPAIIRQRNMPGVIMENYITTDTNYQSIYPFNDAIVLGYCNGIASFLDNKTCSGSANSASSTNAAPLPEACKFTRSDMKDKAKLPFQSATVINYFKEVSEKTTVPAKLLAAIARIENPTIMDFTDQSLGSFGCPTSKTGAKGLMQIQPPGTTGHDAQAINNGARFIGRDVSNLETADYCDIKTSIYLAAGFILKKLQYVKVGDGTKWDPSWTTNRSVIDKVVTGYYGCTAYGGADVTKCEGPYDYADDVWEGIQACDEASFKASSGSGGGSSSGSFLNKLFKSNLFITQVGNPTTPRPPGGGGGGITPGGKAPNVEADKLKQTIIDLFKVKMVGDWDTQHLQWVYEQLYAVKETNFIRLIANEPVYLCDCVPNQMSGSVQMSQSGGYAADKNKFISHLFHELGHTIYWHREGTESLKERYTKAYYGSNGGFTSYSNSYGFSERGMQEDYAEAITYCLNKQAVGNTVDTKKWEASFGPIIKEVIGGCL